MGDRGAARNARACPRFPVVERRLTYSKPPSYRLFGSPVNLATRDDLLGAVRYSVDSRSRCVVVYQNMHGLRVHQTDEDFRELLELP